MAERIIYILLILFNVTFLCNAQHTLPKLVQKVKPSVFKIITYNRFDIPMKQGTGFFIDSTGNALSNSHVFEDAYKAEIITSKGDTVPVDFILAEDKEVDIIKFHVTKAKGFSFPSLEFNADSLLEGDDVIVIGSPHGLEGTISSGIIASMRDLEGFGDVIQITAPISHGSSGSPVINMDGKVLGIATMIFTQGQNLNFAVDVNKIKKVTIDTIFLDRSKISSLDAGRIVYLDNGGILTKSYFLRECQSLSRNRGFYYGGLTDFCGCYYENLVGNYTDAEISDLISYSSVNNFISTSIYSNEKYYSQLKKCTNNFSWTKDLEHYYYKQLLSSTEDSRKATSLNSKEFCTCTLDKIKSSLTLEESVLFLNALDLYKSKGIDNFKYLSEEVPSVKLVLESCMMKNQKR